MLWILVLGLLLPGHFSALTPCLRRTNLPFLRFLRKFSVPLPASSVLLLRLLGVEAVFLPLQSSVSSPPLGRRSWVLVVAPLRCASVVWLWRFSSISIRPELSLFSRLFSGFDFCFCFGFPLIFLRD